MLDVTVKTLDGQNKTFSIPEEVWTREGMKNAVTLTNTQKSMHRLSLIAYKLLRQTVDMGTWDGSQG